MIGGAGAGTEIGDYVGGASPATTQPTVATAIAGGKGSFFDNVHDSFGGDGGDPGQPGTTSVATWVPASEHNVGGAAGNAINKNGNTLTWLGGNTSPNVKGAIV